MAQQDVILRRLRDALSISDPEWDTSVGTPEYKILEAVAAEIGGLVDFNLLHDYHFDVDSKIGIQLDQFVEMFGIHRLAAKRAIGTVILSRGTPADHNYLIPQGAQVLKAPTTLNTLAIYYQTTVPATIPKGQSSVEVPIEAVVAGAASNTTAGTITAFGTQVNGPTAVTNPNAITGGQDVESDEDLRRRWKRTVLRNDAGTEDMFIAVVQSNPAVGRAAVIGPSIRSLEQLQVSSGSVESQIPDVKFVYPPGSQSLGIDLGLVTEVIGIPFTDYIFADTIPAEATIVNSVKFPNGTVIYLEYDYTPNCSRNDPDNNVTNKIDVFISGEVARLISEQITMKTSGGFTFNNTVDDVMKRDQWVRENETTLPTAGNFFMPLMLSPIVEIPDSIQVGVDTYIKGTDYWKVRDTTLIRGSNLARDGIEWLSTNHPANGEEVIVEYTTNDIVLQVQEALSRVRLVTTDIMTHTARLVPLKFHLDVVFNSNFTAATETSRIADALSSWLEGKPYHHNIQVSDIIDVVYQVPSVDNVRLTRSADAPSDYGFSRFAEDGTTKLDTWAQDAYFNSDEVPVLHSVAITTYAQNTF